VKKVVFHIGMHNFTSITVFIFLHLSYLCTGKWCIIKFPSLQKKVVTGDAKV